MIEEHYIKERGLSPEKTVDYLKKDFLARGKLGLKSTNGGLYPRTPTLLVLDLGLAGHQVSPTSGSVMEISGNGKAQKTLVPHQCFPDGIDIDRES